MRQAGAGQEWEEKLCSKHMAPGSQLDSPGALRRRKLVKGDRVEAGRVSEKNVELNKYQ